MMAVERPSGAGNSPSPVATAASAIQLTLSSLVPRQLQSQSKSLSSSNVTSVASSASTSPHSTPRLTLNRSLSNFATLSSSISNFNGLSNLSASSSAILKERLSQLKHTAQSKHEAAAKAMKSHIEYVHHLLGIWWFVSRNRSQCYAQLARRRQRHLEASFTYSVLPSFVPATVPRARRIQTFVVSFWELLLPGSNAFFIFLLYVHSPYYRIRCLTESCTLVSFDSSFPFLWPILAVYMLFVYIDKAPEHGGRSNQWFRSCLFWRYFADYYPASYVRLSL